MICVHKSIKQRRSGQIDTCISCGVEIIFDGLKWTWLYGMDEGKRKKLRTVFNVDEITGAHS